MSSKKRVESVSRPGTFYNVDTVKGVCSCPAWRYQHKSPSHRTCPHIVKTNKSKERAWPTKTQKPQVRLIAETPKTTRQGNRWCWSRKYDGIRVIVDVDKGTMTTRGGLVLTGKDVERLTSKLPPNTIFDAELCFENPGKTHYDVSKAMDAPKWPKSLVLRVFDVVTKSKKTTFIKRCNKYIDVFTPHYRVDDIIDDDELIAMAKQFRWEGVVVRDMDHVQCGKQRCMYCGYKLKVVRDDDDKKT